MHLSKRYGIISLAVKSCIRVWRSLVARLNGVQEAAGSTPVTRTILDKSELLSDWRRVRVCCFIQLSEFQLKEEQTASIVSQRLRQGVFGSLPCGLFAYILTLLLQSLLFLFPFPVLSLSFFTLEEGYDIGEEGPYDRFELMFWDSAFCFGGSRYIRYFYQFPFGLYHCHTAALLSLSVFPPYLFM